MKTAITRFLGTFGAIFAAACCLGLPLALSAATAVGLGFLLNDVYLYPLFVGFLALSLWLQYRRGRGAPFGLALAGALLAALALWFTVTGLAPQNTLVIAGLAIFVAAQIWDFVWSRREGGRQPACAAEETIDPQRRRLTGAAVSIAAAGVFYGLAKSVARHTKEPAEGEIACWGINSCKGTTECATAFNACKGQNDCRGRGYLYATPAECQAQGGVPLAESEAAPRRRQS